MDGAKMEENSGLRKHSKMMSEVSEDNDDGYEDEPEVDESNGSDDKNIQMFFM